MTTRNLEQEFFMKVKGWSKKQHPMGCECYWNVNDGFLPYSNSNDLPPISTSWDAFHEWVVPELQRRTLKLHNCHAVHLTSLYQDRIIKFIWNDKTPQRALEWAMEELEK